jgi:hypothetical protein
MRGESLFVRSSFVHSSFVWKWRERRRRRNDEGKKSDDEGKKKQRKGLVGEKVIFIVIFNLRGA